MGFVSAASRGARRVTLVVASAVPVLARDMIGLAGASAFVYGASLVYQPAGYMVGGAMMMVAAFSWARRS